MELLLYTRILETVTFAVDPEHTWSLRWCITSERRQVHAWCRRKGDPLGRRHWRLGAGRRRRLMFK
jgi:hypothetical protein